MFRSSHAEVRPVKNTPRPTPYSRPGRGGFGGYGGYGGKYGSGYERGYNRGRGRGPPPGHFHAPYEGYGGNCECVSIFCDSHGSQLRAFFYAATCTNYSISIFSAFHKLVLYTQCREDEGACACRLGQVSHLPTATESYQKIVSISISE